MTYGEIKACYIQVLSVETMYNQQGFYKYLMVIVYKLRGRKFMFLVKGVFYDKEEPTPEPTLQRGVTYDTINFESISLPGEKWLPVTDCVIPFVQPYYYISNCGRLYSTMYKNGLGGIREINPQNDGYVKTNLRLQPNENNRYDVPVNIHRVEMMVFNPLIDEDMDRLLVNHKDGNKSNNNIDNLEWCTYQYNAKHAYDTGLNVGKKGEDHPCATHTNAQVHKICEGLEKGLSIRDTAIYAGMEPTKYNRRYISRVKRKDLMRHISDQYNIPPEQYYNRVLTDKEIHQVCLMLQQGMTCSEIATAMRPDYKNKKRSRFMCTLNKIKIRIQHIEISKYYDF